MINAVLALLASLLAAGCYSIGATDDDVSRASVEERSLAADSGVRPYAASETRRSAELEDTDWKFIPFGDHESLGSADIYLRLRSPGKGMRLFDGCNVIFGRYELSGKKLRFSINGVTDWACSEATDKQRRFREILQASATWNIRGKTLQLYNSGNNMLARFEARAVK